MLYDLDFEEEDEEGHYELVPVLSKASKDAILTAKRRIPADTHYMYLAREVVDDDDDERGEVIRLDEFF